MKYIKKFKENKFRYKIKIGDNILLHIEPSSPKLLRSEIKLAIDYVNSHICKIVEINRYGWEIKVEFKNVPDDIQSYFGKSDKENTFYRYFSTDNIVDIGNSIEEIKIKKDIEKYNL